ncbi:HlyD family type I secretion periplasmic adaptor subunit [Thauera sp.]|uniref:HlyD family type I secretion periplasmic adaptor subunit n=1 Tax=Thauera sp. TaxID=1905334 RepID=UPI00258BE6B2|nr:HlyD family type I secretion periplasmic adaptor subunit [Thauera sp.]
MSMFWFLRPSDPDHPSPLAASLHAPRTIMWATIATVAVFLGWAWVAELDQVSRAAGSVIASSRTQVIQSQEGGTLDELLVREGDVVERGQLLARLERTRAEAAYLETRARAAGLAATVARLRAEVFAAAPVFPPEVEDYPQFRDNQLALLRKRRAAIDEEIGALESMAALVLEELAMNRPLLASGDVSRSEVLRLERQLAELQAQITNKRNKYFQDAQAELNKAQEDLAGVEQTLAQRRNVLEQTEIRAPLHGVVKNVRITTLGGVIRPGEDIMQIVPLEDDLVIEARLNPADIAFVRQGLPTTVKVDAYDYTIYGDLPGRLTYISADTLREDLRQGEQPYYRILVRTEGRQFSGRPDADLDILPGMTATVEIKTGSSTVLQYLTKPVTKTLSEALGER